MHVGVGSIAEQTHEPLLAFGAVPAFTGSRLGPSTLNSQSPRGGNLPRTGWAPGAGFSNSISIGECARLFLYSMRRPISINAVLSKLVHELAGERCAAKVEWVIAHGADRGAAASALVRSSASVSASPGLWCHAPCVTPSLLYETSLAPGPDRTRWPSTWARRARPPLRARSRSPVA